MLAEVIDFVNQKTKARLIYDSGRLEGLVAENDEEMKRITEFIEQASAGHPKLDYQRNTVYLRFCHADYHKGAALAELARLIEVPRENIFAAAIITTTSRCWMGRLLRCHRVRQMRSTQSKPPSVQLADTSPESNTAPVFTKRFCIL